MLNGEMWSANYESFEGNINGEKLFIKKGIYSYWIAIKKTKAELSNGQKLDGYKGYVGGFAPCIPLELISADKEELKSVLEALAIDLSLEEMKETYCIEC